MDKAFCLILISQQIKCHALVADVAACVLQYEYLWADGVKVKKPTRLSAPDYVNNLFDWIECQVSSVTKQPCHHVLSSSMVLTKYFASS